MKNNFIIKSFIILGLSFFTQVITTYAIDSTSTIVTNTLKIPFIAKPVEISGPAEVMGAFEAYAMQDPSQLTAMEQLEISKVTGDTGFTVSGSVELLGEQASVSIKNFSTSLITLSFLFKSPITIQMSTAANTFPNIVIPSFDLTLPRNKNNQQFVLKTTNATAFNQKVTITVSQEMVATILIPTLTVVDFLPASLSKIVKDVQQSSAGQVVLHNLKVVVDNFLKIKTGTEKFSATATGTMDFSPLKIPTLSNASSLALDGTIDQTKGVFFKASLSKPPTLACIEVLQNPYLYLVYNPFKKTEKGDPTILTGIGGQAPIKLPGGFGAFTMNLKADYDDGTFTIEGFLPKPLDLHQLFTIEKPYVTFSNKCDISINGETSFTMFDTTFDIVAEVDIQTDGTLNIDGTITSTPYKPFSKTKIPEIENIILEDAQVQWTKKGDSETFLVLGETKVLNTDVELSISYIKGDPSGMIGKAKIKQANWRLPYPALNQLVLVNPMFIISTVDDYEDATDPELANIKVKKGLSLYTQLPLGKGMLLPLGKITKQESKTVNVYGTIGEKAQDLSLYTGFPLPDLPVLKKFVTNVNLGLLLTFETATEPFVGLKGTFDLQKIPLLTSSPLPMTVEGGVTEAGVELGMQMTGTLVDPLVFLKGVSISNVAGTITLVPDPEPVSGFSYQGTAAFKFLNQTGTIAVVVSVDDGLPLLSFSFNQFGLQDLVSMLNAMGSKIPSGTIPNFGLKNVYFYFAPEDVSIMNTQYSKGASMHGTLEMFGESATMQAQFPLSLTLSDSAVFKATLNNPINFGPLSITADTDSSKGPDVGVTLAIDKQEVSLDGKMKLFVIEGSVQGTFSPTGGTFTTTDNLGIGNVTLSVAMKELISKTPDVDISGSIDIETSKILQEIEDKINQNFFSPVLSGFKTVAMSVAKVLDNFIPTQALGQAASSIVSAANNFETAANNIAAGNFGGASQNLGAVIEKVGEATGKAIVSAIKGIFDKPKTVTRTAQVITKDVSDLYTTLVTLGSILEQNQSIANTQVVNGEPGLKVTTVVDLFSLMRSSYMTLVQQGQLQGTSTLVFTVYTSDQLQGVVGILNETYKTFNNELKVIQNTFYSKIQQQYPNLTNLIASLKQLNPTINIPPLPPQTPQQEGAFESLANKIPTSIPLPNMGLDIKLSFDGSPTDIDVKLVFSLHPFVSNVTLDIDVPLETILKDPESFIGTLADKIWDAAKDDIKKALHL